MINTGATSTEDAAFDLDAWQREWVAIEAEMKAVSIANEIAEGRDFIVFSDQAIIRISDTLSLLSTSRPLFHSEADFQHALAWEIQRQLPEAKVRLEFPVRAQARSIHLDILVVLNGRTLVIELKYATSKLTTVVDGEEFSLKERNARDLCRYDFIKDIKRLEQVVESRANCIGYAILLTNDGAYWRSPKNHQTVDVDFQLHQGRILHGELKWKTNAGQGTIKGRETSLALRGTYALNWIDYSQSTMPFKYVPIEVR